MSERISTDGAPPEKRPGLRALAAGLLVCAAAGCGINTEPVDQADEAAQAVLPPVVNLPFEDSFETGTIGPHPEQDEWPATSMWRGYWGTAAPHAPPLGKRAHALAVSNRAYGRVESGYIDVEAHTSTSAKCGSKSSSLKRPIAVGCFGRYSSTIRIRRDH